MPFTVIRPTCTLQFTISFPGSQWQGYLQTQAGYVSSYGHRRAGGDRRHVRQATRRRRRRPSSSWHTSSPTNEEAQLVAIDATEKDHVGNGEPAGELSGVRSLAVHFFRTLPPGAHSFVACRTPHASHRDRQVSTRIARPTNVDGGANRLGVRRPGSPSCASRERRAVASRGCGTECEFSSTAPSAKRLCEAAMQASISSTWTPASSSRPALPNSRPPVLIGSTSAASTRWARWILT